MGTELNCSIAEVSMVDGIKGVQTRTYVRDNLCNYPVSKHTWTRAHTVDSNSFPNLLVGQFSSERNNCALRRCIVKEVTSANIMVNR